jgi:hypothetical protein
MAGIKPASVLISVDRETVVRRHLGLIHVEIKGTDEARNLRLACRLVILAPCSQIQRYTYHRPKMEKSTLIQQGYFGTKMRGRAGIKRLIPNSTHLFTASLRPDLHEGIS